MMIMKCLVLGCVMDNQGGGMRILNVNNGNHDRRTDTIHLQNNNFYTKYHNFFQAQHWKISHKLSTPTPTLGDKLQCVREYSLIIASSSFRLRLYLVRAGDCS